MRKVYLPNIFDDINEFYHAVNNCCSSSQCQKPTHQEKLFLSEDEGKLYIDAHLPGVKPDEVAVTVDPKKRQLTIRGEGKIERENVKYHLKGAQSFFYEIPLSHEIDLDAEISAISKDGILSVAIPKNHRHKPLTIPVKQS